MLLVVLNQVFARLKKHLLDAVKARSENVRRKIEAWEGCETKSFDRIEVR
jgi:hypothetical protein